MIKSSNPALGKNTFERYDSVTPDAERMTINGTFGLIITLMWLYIEFLRLLSKIRQ